MQASSVCVFCGMDEHHRFWNCLVANASGLKPVEVSKHLVLMANASFQEEAFFWGSGVLPKRWLDHIQKPEAICPVIKIGAFADQSPPFNTHGVRLFLDESGGAHSDKPLLRR